jgi:hypothetical protein
MINKKLLEEIKKTIVFIGETRLNRENKSEGTFIATGVLVQIDNIFHLITAKHVVFDTKQKELKDVNLWITFNTKSGKVTKRSIKDIKNKFSVEWIFHPNEEIDLAIIPTALDPQNDDVKVVPSDLFLKIEQVNELYDVFFLSFQPGIPIEGKIEPVIRAGTISRINKDKTFYIDGLAYPGNSGSPVFLKPSPIRFDEKRISLGEDPFGGKFIGIIGEYLPYQKIAVSVQTGRPRVVFEENTGLSKVWSVEYLKEIIESKSFKTQLEQIKSTLTK